MTDWKRKQHGDMIVEAIVAKGPDYSQASVSTFKTDALAIFESFVAEASEAEVVAALTRQGFKSPEVYLTTFRDLARIAKSRRKPAE